METARLRETWTRCAPLLAELDALGRLGGNALVKIDGGRSDDGGALPETYTVVLAGGRLRDEFFRRDGADLEKLLRDAIEFFKKHAVAAD
ncbi:MAG: hypothetical protein H0T46_32465 [Deltaproteobacteria bacterium]|nr:hypothetical protein [Deltaproteobacteria bacterium]